MFLYYGISAAKVHQIQTNNKTEAHILKKLMNTAIVFVN